MKKTIFVLFFALSLQVLSQTKADFLVIENPKDLVLYNKYKQPLDNKDINLFVPFKPLPITKKDGVFSDGVRGYTEININNNSFYILKEKGGEYYHKEKTGKRLTFNNCKILYDSVTITQGNKILFRSPLKDSQRFLNKGELIIRVFEDENLTYSKIGSSDKYGWAELKKNENFWESKKKSVQKLNKITEKIEGLILDKFTESNQTMENIYNFLNKEKNSALSAPKWKVTVAKDKIIATLTHSFPLFLQSNLNLANNMESLLAGTGLKVSINSDNITIGF